MTVTSTLAPLRAMITAASCPLNLVLTGTIAAPACHSPRAAAIQRAELGAQIATRSPTPTPISVNPAAKRRASS